MFRSLLVPLDGTSFSEHALSLALDISSATGAAIHLARVHDSDPPDGLLSNSQFQFEGVDMNEYESRSRAEERHYLDRMVTRASAEAAGPVDAVLLEGEIARRLEHHARVTGADAVILTTHAREGLARAWAGSVAESLIRKTTLPVLTLRWPPQRVEPPAVEVRRILVPLDGSPLAEAILAPALGLAEAMNATVCLMHAVHSGAMGRSRSADAHTYLQRMAQQAQDRGLHTDTLVKSSGTTSEAICMAAHETDADIIALATHGRSGVGKAMLGSVTLDVLHHSQRPLMIRRPALA
jgi:nucleotide-binding universal stress UspA family protein